MDSVERFVMEPAAQGVLVKCRVTRDRRGMDRGFYPTYFLHMEKDDGKKASRYRVIGIVRSLPCATMETGFGPAVSVDAKLS